MAHLTDLLNRSNLILASGSPRRKALLAEAGLNFSVVKPNVEETHPIGYKVEDIPVYLAQKKMRHVQAQHPKASIICADTVVLLEGRLLEKPHNKAEALHMLAQLSGKMHVVITGVSYVINGAEHCFSEHTKVCFNTLDAEEIQHYVDTFEPLDKAGAYGIQDWIGLVGIEKIEGCYYNVMGLPVARLFKEVKATLGLFKN